MLRELGLTDAQKQQAKSIFQQARQSAQPLAQQLRANRDALAAAVKANDVAQIHGLSAQQGNLQGQILGIRTEAMAKFYATLTPDQKTKADEFRQKVRQRMQQRMEKRKANNG
jgi:Spy/CpxP family protein refolding chaperone